MDFKEIERKFLVKDSSFKAQSFKSYHIIQAYLNSNPTRCVRVRIMDDKGYITVKGKATETGLSKFEWEKEIPEKEARELLNLCESGVLEKERFLVNYKDYLFEVDVFTGLNAGLIIAEVEISHEAEIFEKPDWLGEEVTGNVQYFNSYLSRHPFNGWGESFLFPAN